MTKFNTQSIVRKMAERILPQPDLLAGKDNQALSVDSD